MRRHAGPRSARGFAAAMPQYGDPAIRGQCRCELRLSGSLVEILDEDILQALRQELASKRLWKLACIGTAILSAALLGGLVYTLFFR